MNMNQQYRAEIRQLQATKKRIWRRHRAIKSGIHTRSRGLQTSDKCARRNLTLELDRACRDIARDELGLTRRLAVLEGRLAS